MRKLGEPYPYQSEFATRNDLPSLVSVPTGCGKTAAVIPGWLWRRRFAGPEVRRASDDPASASSGAEANEAKDDVLGNVTRRENEAAEAYQTVGTTPEVVIVASRVMRVPLRRRVSATMIRSCISGISVSV